MLMIRGVLVNVTVETAGIGDGVKDGVGVCGNESKTPGLQDANESSRMSLHNVLALMLLP